MAGRTSKKSPTKKAVAKKAPTKKTATKKAPAAASVEPVVKNIAGEAKYKLKALQLELNAEDQRIGLALQPQIQKLIARTKRNDRAWKAAHAAWRDGINEFLEEAEKKLPEDFGIIEVNPMEGTFRAVPDPEARGQRMS